MKSIIALNNQTVADLCVIATGGLSYLPEFCRINSITADQTPVIGKAYYYDYIENLNVVSALAQSTQQPATADTPATPVFPIEHLYAAGNGINISNTNIISADVDGETIVFNENGKLKAVADTDSAVAECKAYTDTAKTECKTYTDSAVTECKTYTDTAEITCKAYTDAAKTECKTYTDSAVTECKTYTDAAVASLGTFSHRTVSNTGSYQGGTFTASADIYENDIFADVYFQVHPSGDSQYPISQTFLNLGIKLNASLYLRAIPAPYGDIITMYVNTEGDLKSIYGVPNIPNLAYGHFFCVKKQTTT